MKYKKSQAVIKTFLFIFLISLHPAHGQEETILEGLKVTQTTNIFDAEISYPPPIWQKKADGMIKESEVYRKQNGAHYIFEQIPKGETFDNWTKLYAVTGYFSPKIMTSHLATLSDATTENFLKLCGYDNLAKQSLSETTDEITYVLYCENSSKQPTNVIDGDKLYGSEIGEIGLFTFRIVNKTFISIYHEWRGLAFIKEDPKTWPVSVAELTTMLKRFESIKVYPIKKTPPTIKPGAFLF